MVNKGLSLGTFILEFILFFLFWTISKTKIEVQGWPREHGEKEGVSHRDVVDLPILEPSHYQLVSLCKTK